MLFDQGKLEKMTLRALLPQSNPNEPVQVSDAPEDMYVVQVNPKNSTRNQWINYAKRRVPGKSGHDASYNNTEPPTLQFDLLFDGTGVIPHHPQRGDVPPVGAVASARSDSQRFDVLTEINKLNRVVYDYSGEEHRPRKVRLIWGTLELDCVVTSLSFNFTLFKPDGSPLRAIVSCAFSQAVLDAETALRENRRSADLTHSREVKEGDTLPLIVHRVYGNAALYLEVARVNKLINFRRLAAGSRVMLPPVDKESKP